MENPANSSSEKPKEVVIIIHGIISSRLVTRVLERRLQHLGYTTHNWSYPSSFGSLEKHAAQLHNALEEYSQSGTRVHLVAHSMGAIVARLALSYGSHSCLGRVVLLAPPNHGSPVARFLGPLFWPICPAATQLSSHPHSFVNQLAQPLDREIGIISARYDMLVPNKSTHLEGQQDTICLAATHNSLLFQKSVIRYIDKFLATGKF